MLFQQRQRFEDLLLGVIGAHQRRHVKQVARVRPPADEVAAGDQPADGQLADLAGGHRRVSGFGRLGRAVGGGALGRRHPGAWPPRGEDGLGNKAAAIQFCFHGQATQLMNFDDRTQGAGRALIFQNEIHPEPRNRGPRPVATHPPAATPAPATPGKPKKPDEISPAERPAPGRSSFLAGLSWRVS